jgi:plasmid stability protein
MKEVRVRKLEEWVVEEFRNRARRNGTSLENELREFLRREAARPAQQLAEELLGFRGEVQDSRGLLSDSAALIREDRDARR